jgi:hypothetical protein
MLEISSLPVCPLSHTGFPRLAQMKCLHVIPHCRIAPRMVSSSFFERLNHAKISGVYLAGLNTAHPIFPVFHTPAYSNAGFTVLGLALQSKRKSSYGDALQRSFLKKLNMSRTTATKPPDSWGIIPAGNNLWDYPSGLETP